MQCRRMLHRTVHLATAASLAALLVWAPQADAEFEELNPLERGYAIAARADRSDEGFASATVNLQMILSDARGRSTTRELQIDTLEKKDAGRGDKSLTRFFSPPDVEGTALLSHAKILDPDDQWLYLPALRRVKRISSANKSGPFVGSEFAFEDLTANELGKYDYEYLETTDVDGMAMDVLECRPRYARSGYSRLRCYFDTEIFQSRKIEFFDRGGKLFKTLLLEDYRQYPAGYWRSHRQIMRNHLTGKSTVLEFGDFRFGIDLDARDFEPSALDKL